MTSAAHPLDRHSIRLPGYDYSQPGAYFVTLVAAGRQCLFGEVIDQTVWLNRFGEIVQSEWQRTPYLRREVELGALIAGFKSSVTRRINLLRSIPNLPVWQRNYGACPA